MAKYKVYDYDQTMMVAVSLIDQLMPGTLEYAIHYLVENRINISIFESHYKRGKTECSICPHYPAGSRSLYQPL